MVSLNTELKSLIKSWGADLVGFGDISKGEERKLLTSELAHFTVAISMAVRLQPCPSYKPHDKQRDDHQKIVDNMRENEDVIQRLDVILKKTTQKLKSCGYRYFAIPPVHTADDQRFIMALYNMFPHRTAATLAGLGWIGKNGMLINGQYGPNLVWATVLTNAPITTTSPQLVNLCARCDICQKACPAGAIKGINWSRDRGNDEVIDIRACEKYMETNKARFGRPVCGICFMACPLGAKTTRAG